MNVMKAAYAGEVSIAVISALNGEEAGGSGAAMVAVDGMNAVASSEATVGCGCIR